ncbi:hypothetical protein G6F57_012029 [Rhizopus arrhizus]|nr:hypothetical protein G6F57_012029 [Rhizopus arrhizus]
MFMRVQRGALETHVEAHRAADAALGLVLHAARAAEPVVGVVVAVDEGDVVLLGEADVLLLAQLVFLHRMDVGVVEEDRVVDPGGGDRLHHFAGAGRAARVQQQALAVGRQGQGGALELGHRQVPHGPPATAVAHASARGKQIWAATGERTRAAAPPARAGQRRPRHPPRGESRSSQGTVVSPGRGRYSG